MNIGTLSNIDFIHSIKALAAAKSMLETKSDPLDECRFEIPNDSEPAPEQTESKTGGEKWINDTLFKYDLTSPLGYSADKSALDKVREKLRSEGIDPDKRTPTHEITDEQIEWLSERYDFNSDIDWEIVRMNDFDPAANGTSAKYENYGNFVLDLVYLNVFSFDDVEKLFGVMPFNSNTKAIVIDPELGLLNPDGSYSATWDEYLARINAEYLKAENPDRPAEEIDKTVNDYVERHFELMDLLDSFFARIRENAASGLDVTRPFFEDFSEQLKEDFGGIM